MGNKFLLLPVIGVFTFFTLLLIYTKLAGPIPFSVNSVTTTKSTTFDVIGEGKATSAPDVALINVGISANGQTVKAIQDQMNSTMHKVSDAIKKLGIEEKDIQTTNYNINPLRGDFSAGPAKITGYEASTNLQIKLRKIGDVNSVIDAATSNGANQVGGVSFDIDDKAKLENEAREKAVADAKKKAENASRIAGFKLGRIINYSENFGGYPGPIPLRMEAAKDLTAPTQVEPGSTEINLTVTLSFEIN